MKVRCGYLQYSTWTWTWSWVLYGSRHCLTSDCWPCESYQCEVAAGLGVTADWLLTFWWAILEWCDRYESQHANLQQQSFNMEQANFQIQNLKDTKSTVGVCGMFLRLPSVRTIAGMMGVIQWYMVTSLTVSWGISPSSTQRSNVNCNHLSSMLSMFWILGHPQDEWGG